MPMFIGEAEAMIRFARRIGLTASKDGKSETPKVKPKKPVKKPSYPKGMP